MNNNIDNYECYCDEKGMCNPCIGNAAYADMMFAQYDDDPSPYSGTYSEM